MLTVIVATRNGEKTLPLTLAALAALDAPAGGWKLVVVDNGSDDRTRSILDEWLGRLPLAVLGEPESGKNRALNTAVHGIDGDLAVFIDDDVIPAADWLVHMRNAADANPDFTMFGGPIVARWEVPPPDWIRMLIPQGPAFGVTGPEMRDGPVNPGQIYGGNLAIRTDVFRSGYRFNPDVGPKGGDYPMGGETDLLLRLHRAGHQAWYVSGALVEHLVREYQLSRSWLIRRAVRFGRSTPRFAMLSPDRPMPRIFGIPRHLYRELVERGGRAALAWVTFDPGRRGRAWWDIGDAWGRFHESWRIHREMTHGSPRPQ